MGTLGRNIVNALLLGPASDGRLVHESPIRGDVWAEIASRPSERIDVLIEAYRDASTGVVAARLARRLYDPNRPNLLLTSPEGRDISRTAHPDKGFSISFVEGFVTAQVDLVELIVAILPYTSWTRDLRIRDNLDDIARRVRQLIALQLQAMSRPERPVAPLPDRDPATARMAAVFRILGTLAWVRTQAFELTDVPDFFERADLPAIADLSAELARIVLALRPTAGENAGEPAAVDRSDIFAVSRNRPVELAIERSVPAIKADAVNALFAVSCAKIGWAILDTGIDGSHPAFKDQKRPGQNRIAATFDFTRLRHVVLIDHLYNHALLDEHATALSQMVRNRRKDQIRTDLLTLARDAQQERSINWDIAEPYVALSAPPIPGNPHGTHVAGILGGCWTESDFNGAPPIAQRGVCPDIRLFDFRVVGGSEENTEFALVGALQFIRHLNGRNNRPQIHGANISLSIRHDVRNYACGRTPVCEEAERLVNSGVVVVAAAGNRGYQSYNLADGQAFETYAPSSITDPGNAEAVITVGATHRSSPHSYGVSFFSSRGPTGDGRAKPDLVAPGEKIWSMVPGRTEDALSGTSMAAPHVSGAAAMLMARNPEFVGQAAHIKRILCSTCTDLGRERSFQGAGMLDVLRAMQSV